VEPDRLDPHPDLAGPGGAERELLDPEDVGPAELVEQHRSCVCCHAADAIALVRDDPCCRVSASCPIVSIGGSEAMLMPVDVLSDAITAMRAGVPHSSRTRLAAPWGMRFAPSDGAGCHVVLQGSCWLLPPGRDPIPL